MDMGALRQSKLRSISKSDTGLHEMSRLACHSNGTAKHRPASMDLLYLPSQRSNSDVRSAQTRLLPRAPAPPTDDPEHTYSEVGRRSSPPRGLDDGLYEVVGGRAKTNGKGEACSGSGGPPVTVPSMAPQDPVTAEYACIRKVRKMDRTTRKDNDAAETQQQRFSSRDPQPGPMQPHPRSHEVPRKSMEPFHMHSFPKAYVVSGYSVGDEKKKYACDASAFDGQESIFMGNGEQYIWKPPEEDDIVVPQPGLPGALSNVHGENGQDRSAEIAEMYSKVCKPTKKWAQTSPPTSQESNGQRNPPRSSGSEESDSGTVASQTWSAEEQQDGKSTANPMADPCYEFIGGSTEEADPAYETIDTNWKRDRPPNATLKLKEKKQQVSTRVLPGENFYESINDAKHGLANSSTTTIFTFNDGME
ncbi:hypothetical protein Z043_101987, partial [Scleropages formosus]